MNTKLKTLNVSADALKDLLDDIRTEDKPDGDGNTVEQMSPTVVSELATDSLAVPQRTQTALPGAHAKGNPIWVTALGCSPEERLRQAQDGMGDIERFLFRHSLKPLNRRHCQKMAKALLDAEFEATFQKVTLALDIEKKRAFTAYMRATDVVRRDLFALDAGARGEIAQMLQGIDGEIFKIRAQGEQKIQAMLNQGLISPKEADRERQKNEMLCRDQIEASLRTLRALWRNQQQLLEHTLSAHFGMSQEVAVLE